MTKADIADKIMYVTGFSKRVSAELLETVFAVMKDTLESGEKIKVAGFGNFEIRQKKDRKGRNPQTGETITIKARQILIFKPSSMLTEAVNGRPSNKRRRFLSDMRRAY